MPLTTDPLDSLEVRNLAEAKAAVLRLLNEPDLYLAMVERLPKLAQDSKARLGPGKPIWVRQVAGRWRWRLSAR